MPLLFSFSFAGEAEIGAVTLPKFIGDIDPIISLFYLVGIGVTG